MESNRPESFDGEALSRLLSLGRRGAERPIDELIDWLEEDEGRRWFEAWLASAPLAHLGPAGEAILCGRASIDELRTLHRESKQMLRAATGKEDRLGAIAGYFLSTAAAVIHHDTLLTTRPRAELDPIFLDFAAALKEPWSEFVGRAVERPVDPT